jgi:hypothetical protein
MDEDRDKDRDSVIVLRTGQRDQQKYVDSE